MTVREFLLKKTDVQELCVVRDTGYEDLFAINDNIADRTVKSDSWGTITIRDRNGNVAEVDCHYIDI